MPFWAPIQLPSPSPPGWAAGRDCSSSETPGGRTPSALYWAPGPSSAVLTEPQVPPPHTSSCRGSGPGRGSTRGVAHSLAPKGLRVCSVTAVCPSPAARIPPPAARPSMGTEEGVSGPSAQEAGFTPAPVLAENGARGSGDAGQQSAPVEERAGPLLGARLALSLRPRQLTW